MGDELTRVIAEALRENGIWRCVDCGRVFAEYINGCPHGEVETASHVYLHYPVADRIAAAITPLIEARVREARAGALTEAAEAWTQGAWASTPRHKDRVADRMAAAQYAGDWLRERAEEVRR